MNKNEIFKNGSTTYFNSSVFFPRLIRERVTTLYGFVRRMDDLVDSIPQNKSEFYRLKELTKLALKGKEVDDPIICEFVELAHLCGFRIEWINSFIRSIEMDLNKSEYQTLDELCDYMYGSAEVIGLMMSRILEVPEKTWNYARLLGRSMQYVNFIRDVDEDLMLNRTYLPQEDIEKFGLSDIRRETALREKEKFRRFMRGQVTRYFEMQDKAEIGFNEIPRRYRIPIKTASDMYKWTAKKIYEDPLIVFEKKVKPSIPRILFTGAVNTFKF